MREQRNMMERQTAGLYNSRLMIQNTHILIVYYAQYNAIVDGEASEWVKMESGVPQGTVLGPIFFLAFINDLPEAVNSRVRLFADGCVMYRPVASYQDCTLLQEDLDSVFRWEKKWCMSFNVSKCNSITITRKKKILHDYLLHDTVL